MDRADRPSTAENPLLVGRALVKRYGPRRALAGVDVVVRRGQTVAIVGPAGSGKTTLLRILAGVVRPDSGHVLLRGKRIGRFSGLRCGALRRRDLVLIAARHPALASALTSNVILVDEPAGAFDAHTTAEAMDDFLRAVSGTDAAMVIGTRHLALASRAERIVRIDAGRIVGGVMSG